MRARTFACQPVFALGLSGILACVSGCAPSTHTCSTIGATSNVIITFAPGIGRPGYDSIVTACVAKRCATDRRLGLPRHTFVVVPHVPAHAAVPVDLIVRQNHKIVFTGHTIARTAKNQPNGAGCAPVVWDVGVDATADGRLTPLRLKFTNGPEQR